MARLHDIPEQLRPAGTIITPAVNISGLPAITVRLVSSTWETTPGVVVDIRSEISFDDFATVFSGGLTATSGPLAPAPGGGTRMPGFTVNFPAFKRLVSGQPAKARGVVTLSEPLRLGLTMDAEDL